MQMLGNATDHGSVASISRRLASFTGRARWPIAIAWLIALACAGTIASALPNRLSGGGWDVAGSQSVAVDRALQHGFVGRGASTLTVVVRDHRHVAGSAAFDTRIRAVLTEVAHNRVLDVRSSYGWSTLGPQARQAFLGKDHRTVIDVLGLGITDGRARIKLPAVQDRLVSDFAHRGLEVSLVSPGSFWGEVNAISENSLARAEMITLPLIVLVLLLLFGGGTAALSCLAVGVSSIVFTLCVLTVLAGSFELSVFVENAATMLGLGVGVDYSLFITARFKDELRAGKDIESAIAASLRRSGHTVLFSGITVVASMATLFLVPLGVIRSIALGAVLVVAFSMFTSLLLLPALLHLLGRRIQRGLAKSAGGAHRAAVTPRWETFAGRVMKRPVLFLAISIAGLVLLALPSLGLQNFTPDARIVPKSSPVRAGFAMMQEQFGVGSTSPVQVVVTARESLQPADDAEVLGLDRSLQHLPSVARVDSALTALSAASPGRPLAALQAAARQSLPPDLRQTVDHFVSADSHRLVLSVVPDAPASAISTQRLLGDIRSVAARTDDANLTVAVGGETAQGVDSNKIIDQTMPKVVLAMLAVIYLFLLLTFRSVLLPLKAILINLLSVGATYGALVLVFQHGLASGILGFERTGYIQNFVPVLLLTLLFSLSTDYEVFLLDRVREEYQRTGDNTGSVARGIARTAPLISGAALLMVVVFGAFSFAGILPMKQLGFGLAVAIAIDCTVIRLVVVPASMRLLGSWNWWLPRRRARELGRHRGTGVPAAAQLGPNPIDPSATEVEVGAARELVPTR